MAKPSVLDEAIAETSPSKGKKRKIDQILSDLTDCDDFDRLLDMLSAPCEQWPHTQMAGIIRHVCDHLGVDHRDVNDKNVGEWRQSQAAR